MKKMITSGGALQKKKKKISVFLKNGEKTGGQWIISLNQITGKNFYCTHTCYWILIF